MIPPMSIALALVPVFPQDSGQTRRPEAVRDGWIELFDGKSLEGWTRTGGRYDGPAAWTVEDGALTGREAEDGGGGLIYTAGVYRNFVLDLDAYVTYPFDSGFFLRMTPREEGKLGAQVTLDYRPGGEVGGIYCDGWYFHCPEGAARYRRDAWNHFSIRCVGDPMHVTVWMNGEDLTDFRIPEGGPEFAEEGRIGLQVHGSPGAPEGSKVQFKNIRLLELDPEAGHYFEADGAGNQTITEAGFRAGWRPLFNGRDLTGWKGANSDAGYRVRDGALELLLEGDSPHLMTDDDYRDFHLRLDFKIAKMANSGLFLRALRDGSNPAYSGCEIQILDDFDWEAVTGSKLEDYQFTGGLYGSVANPNREALRPLGEWNTFDVRYRGSRLTAYLNGRLMYDVDTLEVPGDFASRAPEGFIGLQRHAPGGAIEGDAFAWFRNVFLREL